MMELQPSALDVRTGEHSRRVDDVNRNGWRGQASRHPEIRMALRRVLSAVGLHFAPNIVPDWQSGHSASLGVSAIGDCTLGTT